MSSADSKVIQKIYSIFLIVKGKIKYCITKNFLTMLGQVLL